VTLTGTFAYQCPTFQQGSIFDPLLGVSWWFRDAGSAHSVHGPSLRPARRFGTLSQAAWEIRILSGTASDVYWRRIYLHCTEAFNVLEMFQDDTFYKLTYLLTWSLTFDLQVVQLHHVTRATSFNWFIFPVFFVRRNLGARRWQTLSPTALDDWSVRDDVARHVPKKIEIRWIKNLHSSNWLVKWTMKIALTVQH